MEPRHSWTVGETRRTPKGRPLRGIRTDSYCSFEMGSGKDGQLANCLKQAICQLEPKTAFLQEITATGGTLSFNAFWYPNGDTGETFSLELIQAMAAMGVSLDLNVYDDR